MFSQRQIAVFLVFITFGLVGPMVFIGEQFSPSGSEDGLAGVASGEGVPSSSSGSAASVPIVLSQVVWFDANVSGEIVEVQPFLAVNIESNLTVSEANETFSGFSNSSLYSIESDLSIIKAVFLLNNSVEYGNVVFQLLENNFNVLSYYLPASIKLPDSFEAVSEKDGSTRVLSPSGNALVNGAISGTKLEGNSSFVLRIKKVGESMDIFAREFNY